MKRNRSYQKKKKKRWSKVRQFIMSGQGSAVSITRSCKCCTLQDAGLGQESFKCEKLCQPHRTRPQQEQRDCFLGSFSPDRTSVRRLEGQKCLSDYQCPKCGTHLPVGSRLNPFRNLGSLAGLDPR